MQSILSPVVGRLSGVLDRKYLTTVPPLVAFIGAAGLNTIINDKLASTYAPEISRAAT
jgi:hypothetical protein